MSNDSVELIRRAYAAYADGDATTVLQLVDPDLEWTFLDPAEGDPEPRVCHGREELEIALARQAEHGLRAELEEAVGNGDRVMVVVRIPGVDAHRVRKADDRSFNVMTVRQGQIVAMRDCRDRHEALVIVGLG